MEIRILDISEKKKLEDFLVFNYGEKNRELANSYIECMFSNDYRRPCFLIVLEDSKIIGACAFSEEFFTVGLWGISWVCVHEEYRRKGIGEKLIQFCLEEVKSRAHKKVTIILNAYPEIAGLYTKMDFEVIGRDHGGGCFMIRYLGV